MEPVKRGYSIDVVRSQSPDNPMGIYQIRFNQDQDLLLGKMLTDYGSRSLYFETFLSRLLSLNKLTTGDESFEGLFEVIKGAVDEDSGPDFGEIAIISAPEYYVHVYYRRSDSQIILRHPIENSSQASFYDFEVFLKVILWWKDQLKSKT